MGPISPGRWHTWQRLWKIGRMSLLNVGAAPPAAVARFVAIAALEDEPGPAAPGDCARPSEPTISANAHNRTIHPCVSPRPCFVKQLRVKAKLFAVFHRRADVP